MKKERRSLAILAVGEEKGPHPVQGEHELLAEWRHDLEGVLAVHLLDGFWSEKIRMKLNQKLMVSKRGKKNTWLKVDGF